MTQSAICVFDARFAQSRSSGKERDAESGNDYFGARYYASSMGRFLSPDWSAKEEPVPYAKLGNPQTLNLYAFVGNNPMGSIDPDGHSILGGSIAQCEANAAGNGCSTGASDQYQLFASQNQAQQQYGRQPDGSYKADPAKVQKAIDAKTPIGNGQCVAACSALTGVTAHTDSWTPGKSATGLNDTTDRGLAISTFGPDGKFKQPDGDQNSATYMGHDSSGRIQVVDQWPPPGNTQHHSPFLHPVIDYGSTGIDSNGHYHSRENNAYYYHVIIVP